MLYILAHPCRSGGVGKGRTVGVGSGSGSGDRTKGSWDGTVTVPRAWAWATYSTTHASTDAPSLTDFLSCPGFDIQSAKAWHEHSRLTRPEVGTDGRRTLEIHYTDQSRRSKCVWATGRVGSAEIEVEEGRFPHGSRYAGWQETTGLPARTNTARASFLCFVENCWLNCRPISSVCAPNMLTVAMTTIGSDRQLRRGTRRYAQKPIT